MRAPVPSSKKLLLEFDDGKSDTAGQPLAMTSQKSAQLMELEGWKTLPDQPKSFVLLKLTITCDNGDIFSKRGRNQDSVKRITMMSG